MQEAMDSSVSLTSTVGAELKMNAAVTMNTHSKAIGTCEAYIRQLKGDLESPRMWGLARSTTAPKGFEWRHPVIRICREVQGVISMLS